MKSMEIQWQRTRTALEKSFETNFLHHKMLSTSFFVLHQICQIENL